MRRGATARQLVVAAILLTAGLTGCASLPSPDTVGANPTPPGLAALQTPSITSPATPKRTRKPVQLASAPATSWENKAPYQPYQFNSPSLLPDETDPAKILSGQSDDDDTTADASVLSNAELASYALGYLGVRYRMGGTSPDGGFDCSGLVSYVTQQVLGLTLPRRAEEISQIGEHVKRSDLEPGDLVFYNTMHRKFSHVGIYLGDGRFVHSPASGGVVRVESMDLSYWKARFNGARRIASSE